MLLWGLIALLVPALAYMTLRHPAAPYLGAALFWAAFALGIRVFASELSQNALGEDGSFQGIYYAVTDRRPWIIATVMGGIGLAVWAATALSRGNARVLAGLAWVVYAGILIFLYAAPLLFSDLGLPGLSIAAATATRVSALLGYVGAGLVLAGLAGSILSILRVRS